MAALPRPLRIARPADYPKRAWPKPTRPRYDVASLANQTYADDYLQGPIVTLAPADP